MSARGPAVDDAVDAVDALVLAALPDEMRELRAMLADLRPLAGEGRVQRGRWRGRDVALAVTGDGDRNARVGAAAALRRVRARVVIAIGVAGALSPELAMGELLVAHRVMREHGDGVAGAAALAGRGRAAGGRPPGGVDLRSRASLPRSPTSSACCRSPPRERPG